MGEKHDAMWGAYAGEYIAQQEAEIARLRTIVVADGKEKDRLSAIATDNGNQVARLRAALEAARQYVADAGSDEDPETQSNSGALLAEIDKALANKEGK